jgi:hypothetical protein
MPSAHTCTVWFHGLPGGVDFLATSDMLVSISRDVACAPVATRRSSSTPFVVDGNSEPTSIQLVTGASASPPSLSVFLSTTSLVRSSAASLRSSPSQ